MLTLAEEGVELIEVSLTGADALSVIERARKALGPDRPLGAGTVLTADDARAASGPARTSPSPPHSVKASSRHTNSACRSWPA